MCVRSAATFPASVAADTQLLEADDEHDRQDGTNHGSKHEREHAGAMYIDRFPSRILLAHRNLLVIVASVLTILLSRLASHTVGGTGD